MYVQIYNICDVEYVNRPITMKVLQPWPSCMDCIPNFNNVLPPVSAHVWMYFVFLALSGETCVYTSSATKPVSPLLV